MQLQQVSDQENVNIRLHDATVDNCTQKYIMTKFQSCAEFTSQAMGFQICAIGISYKTLFAEPVTFIKSSFTFPIIISKTLYKYNDCDFLSGNCIDESLVINFNE